MPQVTGREMVKLDKQTTPDRFRSLRERIGTQEAVSALLGVTRKSVGCWETGFHPIPRIAVMALLYLLSSAPVVANVAGPVARRSRRPSGA